MIGSLALFVVLVSVVSASADSTPTPAAEDPKSTPVAPGGSVGVGMSWQFWNTPRSPDEIVVFLRKRYGLSEEQFQQLEPTIRQFAEQRNQFLEQNKAEISTLEADQKRLMERLDPPPTQQEWQDIEARWQALRQRMPASPTRFFLEVEKTLTPEQRKKADGLRRQRWAEQRRQWEMEHNKGGEVKNPVEPGGGQTAENDGAALNSTSAPAVPASQPDQGSPENWAVYVERFIADHRLDPVTADSCRSILWEMLCRRTQWRASHSDEYRRVRAARKDDPALQELRTQLQKGEDRLFKELQIRLERIKN